MYIHQIREIPTCSEHPRSHESMTRAYHILAKVKDYLKRGVPNDVLLELIEDMEKPYEPGIGGLVVTP